MPGFEPRTPKYETEIIIIIIISSNSSYRLHARYLKLHTSTNHVPTAHSVTAILWLQFMVRVMLFLVVHILYFEVVPVAPVVTGITFVFKFHT